MTKMRGLGNLPVVLTDETQNAVEGYRQLRRDLGAIEYPKSGRWETAETAIAVLEALERFLASVFDEDASHVEHEIHDDESLALIYTSQHTAVIQDVITHFKQGRWGVMDPRLAPQAGGAGAAHDDNLLGDKQKLLDFVNASSASLKGEVKDHKAMARKFVVDACRHLDFRVFTNRNGPPKVVTATMLASWEKRPPKNQRRRADAVGVNNSSQ